MLVFHFVQAVVPWATVLCKAASEQPWVVGKLQVSNCLFSYLNSNQTTIAIIVELKESKQKDWEKQRLLEQDH